MKMLAHGATKGLGVAFLLAGATVVQADVEARAELRLCSDSSVVLGEAKLEEEKSDEGIKLVSVELKMEGLTAGKHGVHIHEFGNCEPCGAAGGHFDPGPSGLTVPDANHPFHSGDLVNIEGFGKAKLKTETTRVTLSPGPLSVFDGDNSAIIVHVDEDTYCPEGPDGMVEPGCAGGGRFACGIIRPKR